MTPTRRRRPQSRARREGADREARGRVSRSSHEDAGRVDPRAVLEAPQDVAAASWCEQCTQDHRRVVGGVRSAVVDSLDVVTKPTHHLQRLPEQMRPFHGSGRFGRR